MLAFTVAMVVASLFKGRKSALPYPPGPKPSRIPLIGNMMDMPSSQEWKTFAQWNKEHGPLVMVEVLGQKMCIVGSHKVASDLLDGKSAIYSDRPAMPMVNDLMDWRFNMGLQPYTESYKRHRKAFHHGFNKRVSDEYQYLQTVEVNNLLKNLLDSPEQFDGHLKDSVAATIMMIGLGYKTTGSDDRFVSIAESAQLAMVTAARPGAFLVDVLPWLKHVPEWVPGAGFQKVARRGWEFSQDLQKIPFAWAQQQYEQGLAQPSFFKKLRDTPGFASEDPKEEEHIVRCATAVMYATAADTILSSMLTFVLGMIHTPHVVKLAQEELDRVIGTDRLPTLADRESLPYVTAVAKEALRWEVVIPMGVPHRLMEDDVYNGMFIPAGTVMIPNQWGMAHEESVYPNPMEYRPERFLVPTSQMPPDPNQIAFGFGRRICPGRFVAENQLWLTVASILACFDISAALDAQGKPILPPRDYTSGMASRPAPFKCQMKPRHSMVKDLIAHNLEANAP